MGKWLCPDFHHYPRRLVILFPFFLATLYLVSVHVHSAIRIQYPQLRVASPSIPPPPPLKDVAAF